MIAMFPVIKYSHRSVAQGWHRAALIIPLSKFIPFVSHLYSMRSFCDYTERYEVQLSPQYLGYDQPVIWLP